MLVRKAARLLGGLVAAGAMLGMAVSAQAQEKKIKIGVIYDLTGPLAGGGSELQYTGAKIMLDQYAKKDVEGYKVEAIYADAQSKPDVAINEAVRLIEQEKVDMLLGFFSSAQCVPVAARVEQLKSSCGSPPAFPPRCSTTRITNMCSVRRQAAISSA
jgi:ABC-type branched-subunit amino acid transport system substrate-binding protein